MRILFAALLNLVRLVLLLLTLPLRLLSRRRTPAYVQFRLRGDPPYRRVLGLRRWLTRREKGQVSSLEELSAQLTALAGDPQVKGALFLLEDLAAPPAKREALTRLFAELRRAGKEVVAHALAASNAEYELMCSADRVLLSPGGRVELVGFAAEAMAVGDGLRRAGVQAHFVRRGDYKTAPELFTNGQVSDIQRQTLEGFLDEQYARLVEALVQGRKLTAEAAKQRIDEGPYSAQRALDAGLCDALVSEADLPAFLALPKGARTVEPATEQEERAAGRQLSSFEGYNATRLWPTGRFRRLRRRPRLGVVSVAGVIVSGEGGGMTIGGRAAGAQAIARALRAAGRDRRSAGVVLYVSSPGGSTVASEQLLEAVQRLARKKPVVAFFDRVAASGGYMAALGAKEIWSDRSAITGSIGVFGGKFDVSELLGRLGIHRTVLTRGRNAALGSAARGFTESERAALEAEVEESYQVFLRHVAKARGMSVEDVHRLAEGRVYSGQGALAVKLVDRVGGFEDACRRALELAGRGAQAFDLALYQRSGSPLSLAALLRSAAGARLYALWMPVWQLPGLEGGERF